MKSKHKQNGHYHSWKNHPNRNHDYIISTEYHLRKWKLEFAKSIASTRKNSKVWEQYVKLPLQETIGGVKTACKYYPQVYFFNPNIHDNSSLIRHMEKI